MISSAVQVQTRQTSLAMSPVTMQVGSLTISAGGTTSSRQPLSFSHQATRLEPRRSWWDIMQEKQSSCLDDGRKESWSIDSIPPRVSTVELPPVLVPVPRPTADTMPALRQEPSPAASSPLGSPLRQTMVTAGQPTEAVNPVLSRSTLAVRPSTQAAGMGVTPVQTSPTPRCSLPVTPLVVGSDGT